MSRVSLEWEMPTSVLEDLFSSEFSLSSYINVMDAEWDEDASAVYFSITVDSGDLDRIPESSIFGHIIDD